MDLIQKYKDRFGDEIIGCDGKYIYVPEWCARMLLDRSGLRSKRRRIQKKVLTRMVIQALILGIRTEWEAHEEEGSH